MSDESGRDHPDPTNNDEILSFYNEQAPRLVVYLRSAIRGAALTDHDAEEIFQETWRRVIDALKSRQIENPRAYSLRVLAGCVQKRVAQAARWPRQLPADDHAIADIKGLRPDEAAEQAEVDQAEDRRRQLWQWVERLLATLDQLDRILSELHQITHVWSPPGENGQITARGRRRGRPTKAEKAHQILKDLPGQIAFLQEFLRELH
jgi:DNA-directed RNA polymerase specialized sigma24 family protein